MTYSLSILKRIYTAHVFILANPHCTLFVGTQDNKVLTHIQGLSRVEGCLLNINIWHVFNRGVAGGAAGAAMKAHKNSTCLTEAFSFVRHMIITYQTGYKVHTLQRVYAHVRRYIHSLKSQDSCKVTLAIY